MITAEEARKNTQLRINCPFDRPGWFPIGFYMDPEGSWTKFLDVVDWNIREEASMGPSSAFIYISIPTSIYQIPDVNRMVDFLRNKGFSAYVCVSDYSDDMKLVVVWDEEFKIFRAG